MVANVKVIDISRSYVPIDPNSFPESMHSTNAEDSPEQRVPSVPYDGYNFMPTAYGYMSYFGVNSELDIGEVGITFIAPSEQAQIEASIIASYNTLYAPEVFTTMADVFAYEGVTNEADFIAVFIANYCPLCTDLMSIALDLDSGFVLVADSFTPVRVDDLFVIQTLTLQNFIIALTERGIFTKYAGASGAWIHVIDLPAPSVGQHKNWTKCVIENAIYMYRANEAHFWVCREAELFVPTEQTATHINMAGQLGCFKAGGRLGFWDSANSIAWSNPDDLQDFVPSLETGAGAAIFQQIIGKIVNVIQHGNGFIIYATRSITFIQRGSDAYMFWVAQSIFNDNGISYLQEACMGQPDTTHFAYTTFGIVKIENGRNEYVIPEVFTYLKESREPVYLQLLEGRYLFFRVLNQRYTEPAVNFSYEVVPASTTDFKTANRQIADATQGISICKGMRAAETNHEGSILWQRYGYNNSGQANVPGQVPMFEDNLATIVPLEQINGWKDFEPGFRGSKDYFLLGSVWDKGGIPKIDSPDPDNPVMEFFFPDTSPPLIAGFVNEIHKEPNNKDFWMKQDFLWLYEDYYVNRDWKAALEEKEHEDIVIEYDKVLDYNTIASPVPPEAEDKTKTKLRYEFGPFVDPSYFSEHNRVYGVASKSAWEQRSLTKGIMVDIEETIEEKKYEAKWVAYYSCILSGAYIVPIPASVPDTFPVFENNADFLANYEAVLQAFLVAHSPFPDAVVGNLAAQGSDAAAHGPCFMDDRRCYQVQLLEPSFTSENYITYLPAFKGGKTEDVVNVIFANYPVDPLFKQFEPVYIKESKTQKFSKPTFRTEEIDTCIVKELGFTEIIGHGHYGLGGFVQDNSIPEAPDYEDACDENPKKKKQTYWLGFPIPGSNAFACGARSESVMIDGSEYDFPAQSITLPPTSFLLQDGSIEPIYPQFPGAFVYDLQYKKWGKMKQDHMCLLNYSPINSHAGDAIIPHDIFNVNAGCLLPSGKIALFDKFPADSIIKIGKIGYFRKGFTTCEELIVQFRDLATGSVSLEGSLDGKTLDPALSQISAYTDTLIHRIGFNTSARWFNVCIEGIYDIKNIDYMGDKQGKR